MIKYTAKQLRTYDNEDGMFLLSPNNFRIQDILPNIKFEKGEKWYGTGHYPAWTDNYSIQVPVELGNMKINPVYAWIKSNRGLMPEIILSSKKPKKINLGKKLERLKRRPSKHLEFTGLIIKISTDHYHTSEDVTEREINRELTHGNSWVDFFPIYSVK